MAHSKVLFVLLIGLLIVSCGKKYDEAALKDNPSLSLIVKDSIKVDYAGLLNLQDVDTENERLLLYDRQRNIFLITDHNGSALHQFSKNDDEKGGFSFLLGPAMFHTDGQIRLIAMNGIISYDLHGNLSSHIPYSNEDPPGFSGRPMFAEEFEEYDGKLLGKGVVARGEYGKNEKEFYDQFLLLSWFDPASGKYERIINLEEESLFKNGRAYEVTEMMPVYTIFRDKIFLVAGGDPYLNVYQAKSPHQLISRTKLSYSPFYVSDGQDMNAADPKAIQSIESSGNTLNLKATSDYLIAGYSSGYDAGDRIKYNDRSMNYQDFKKIIDGKYPDYIHVMDHDGNMLLNMENSLNIDLREFTTRDEHIWAMKKVNLEEEEDFVMIYKIAIE